MSPPTDRRVSSSRRSSSASRVLHSTLPAPGDAGKKPKDSTSHGTPFTPSVPEELQGQGQPAVFEEALKRAEGVGSSATTSSDVRLHLTSPPPKATKPSNTTALWCYECKEAHVPGALVKSDRIEDLCFGCQRYEGYLRRNPTNIKNQEEGFHSCKGHGCRMIACECNMPPT